MRTNSHRSAAAGVLVAALGISFALGATASAGPERTEARQAAAALDKAEKKAVKKIATRIATQRVRKMAPRLTVAKARTADTAARAAAADTAAHAVAADMATNAQNAANAATVGGLDVKRINSVVAAGGPAVKVIDVGGFTLTASCAAGTVDLIVASTVPGGLLRSVAIDNNEVVATQGTNNLTATGFSILVPGGDSRGSVSMQFVSATGQGINAWIGYRNDAPGGCAFFGNYLLG